MTPQEARSLLLELSLGFQGVLGDALVGVYLHGSLAIGSFSAGSDIDFLAVARRPLTQGEKDALLLLLWNSRGRWPAKGVEMSVVTAQTAARPTFECPYELHFSPASLAPS